MALQSLPQPVFYPAITQRLFGTPALTSVATLDAAGEYVAYIFKAKEAMTISHVGVKIGTVAGSGTLDVRIETVNATTGLPSGSLWALNTNLAGSALAGNIWTVFALTAAASIAVGDTFCVKFLYNSGTSVIIQQLSNMGGVTGLPYQVLNTGTPTKSALSMAMVALGSSAVTFYNLRQLYPWTSVTTATTYNNTTHDWLGVRFKLPFKCRCAGMSLNIGAAADFDAALLDDAGVELNGSRTTFDSDVTLDAATSGFILEFDNPVVLEKDVWYRAVRYPAGAANIVLHHAVTSGSDYLASNPAGENWMLGTKAAGGAITDTALGYPLVDLYLDQLDDAVQEASLGGGSVYLRRR